MCAALVHSTVPCHVQPSSSAPCPAVLSLACSSSSHTAGACRPVSCVQLKLAHGWCLPELLSPPTAQAPARPGQAGSSRGSGGSSSTAAEASTPSRHPSSTRHSPGATAHSLTLVGLRPYFLGPTDPAVTNDIEMGNNMWLLTGANMAGEITGVNMVVAITGANLAGEITDANMASETCRVCP